MNSISHFISIILSIGSFLGLANVPPEPPPITPLPGLEQGISSSTLNNFPLIPALNKLNLTPTSQSTPKQKLPTLAINAPIFKTVPVAKTKTPTVPIASPPSHPVTTPALPPITSTPPATLPPPVAPPPAPTQTSPTNTDPSLSHKATAAAVNIYCTVQNGAQITIVTGSGVVIDPRGVVLTNAHVADHVLVNDFLNNSNAGCIIRGGSPAHALYKTTLLYISPNWIQAHGYEITQNIESQETGEGDYALLLITGSYNSGPIPSSLPFISADTSTNSLNSGSAVLAVGYPAGNLNGNSVVNNLLVQTAALNIKAIYSFAGGGKDLIRTNESFIAVKGSSGGGVLNANGQLIGLIATTVPSGNSSLQDLQAISLYYINNDLLRAAGRNLSGFLSRDLSAVANDFHQNVAPGLMQFIPH